MSYVWEWKARESTICLSIDDMIYGIIKFFPGGQVVGWDMINDQTFELFLTVKSFLTFCDQSDEPLLKTQIFHWTLILKRGIRRWKKRRDRKVCIFKSLDKYLPQVIHTIIQTY